MQDENPRILQELLDAQRESTAVVLATIVRARGSVPRHSGTKMLVYADGRTSGTIGGGEMEARVIAAARTCLQNGRPEIIDYALVDPGRGDPGVCGGEVEIYLEPYGAPATVLVVGCGHVGREVAALAHWLGYRVLAYDDRAGLATPEQVPEADAYLTGDLAEVLQTTAVTPNTYIVVVTRNVTVDLELLPVLAGTPAPYIGVMGSRRRWVHTRDLLREGGMPEDQLARFHSPLGLELNAESPREIALSILAEITMLRREGTGERMHAAVDNHSTREQNP